MEENMKQLSYRTLFFAAVFSLAEIFALPPANAALPAPDKQVEQTIHDVKQVVQAQSNKESPVLDQKLRGILYPLFDFEEMSRSALGANWSKATAAEQKDFVELFSDLLARTYLKKIKSGVSQSKIEISDAKVDGSKALVKTSVTSDGQPVSIDYRLKAEGDTWKVYDVLIENVGLISNYRVDFGSVIRKDGMQGLIQKLKSKEMGTTEKGV
jgi:phospholipid transport system substrate-binding protein